MSRGLQGYVGNDNDAVQRGDLEESTGSCCLLGWGMVRMPQGRISSRGFEDICLHLQRTVMARHSTIILASEAFRPQSRSWYKSFRRSLISTEVPTLTIAPFRSIPLSEFETPYHCLALLSLRSFPAENPMSSRRVFACQVQGVRPASHGYKDSRFA